MVEYKSLIKSWRFFVITGCCIGILFELNIMVSSILTDKLQNNFRITGEGSSYK